MKAEKIEWRTYANLLLPAVVSSFARDLFGAQPQPMANPIAPLMWGDMEERAASSRPSQAGCATGAR